MLCEVLRLNLNFRLVDRNLVHPEPNVKYARSQLLNKIQVPPVGTAVIPIRGIIPEKGGGIQMGEYNLKRVQEFEYRPALGFIQATIKDDPLLCSG